MTEVPEKKKRVWLRRVIGLFLVGLFLLGLAFLALQTPPAKRFMARQINQSLEGALPWPAELKGIGGLLPFVVTLEALRLGEAKDPWLTLTNVAMNLEFLPFLKGQVSVERLAAEAVVLNELPEAADEEEEVDGPFVLPLLSDLPPWIRLGNLEVSRLVLGEAIAGERIVASVGGAYLPEADESIQIRIRGMETTDSNLTLTGSLRDGVVNLSVSGEDTTIFSSLAGVEGPFAVDLGLQGPLSGADMDLDITRAGAPLLRVDALLRYESPLGIDGAVTVVLPEDLVSSDVIAKLGPEVALELDIALDEAYGLTFSQTTVKTAHADVLVDGSFSLKDQAIDLVTTLGYDDFNRLLAEEGGEAALPLHAELPLSGSLRALAIVPKVQLGGADWMGGALDVGLNDTITAKGEVTVYPVAGLVPEAYREVLADGGIVTLDLAYAAEQVTLTDTAIRVGETRLVADGTVNMAESLLDLRLAGAAPDLNAFESLAGSPLAGAVTFTVEAKGTGEGTTLKGRFDVAKLQLATTVVPEGTLSVDVKAGGFPDALTDAIEATLNGRFPGMQLQPEVTRDLTLDGVVAINALKQMRVTDLNITDGNLAMTADGTIDLESRDADFKSQIVVAELGEYATLADLPYRGAANFQVDVASGDGPGSLIARINGRLNELDGLPSTVEGVAGSALTLKATAHYDGTEASVRDLYLEGRGIRAEGQGAVNTKTQALNVALSGGLDDIAPFSALAKRPLSGAANFELAATGTTEDLSADVTLRGENLILDMIQASEAVILVKASGIPSDTVAELDVVLTENDASLSLRAAVGHTGSQLDIRTLTLVAGENQLSGSGRVNLETLRGEGEVNAVMPELAALKTWLKLPLEGAVELQATLTEGPDTLTGNLTVDGLVASAVKLGHAEGTFDVSDVFETPAGTIALRATELDTGDIRLTSLDLNAEGPPSGLQIGLDSKGIYKEFTRFHVESGGLISNESLSFDLRELNFGLEEYTFSLREEATLSWREGDILLTPFVLESESGTLIAAGRYNSEAVDVRVEWEELSLGLVELLAMDPMAGILDGSLTITGAPSAPDVRAESTLQGYNPSPGENIDFPGMDGELEMDIAAGQLSATLSATVAESTAFNGEAGFPLELSLSPCFFSIAEAAPLEGSLSGTGDLTVVPPLLSWDGQAMAGTLKADLRLEGTYGTPLLDGTVTVSEGYYENGSSSTILDDLEILLEASGNTVRIAKFEGTDGAGGTVTGKGQIVLDPDTGSPYDISLSLDNPRLVHRDDFRAQGDGTLRLYGDSGKAALEGKLAVSPAYFTIPESSTETQITTVEYTEAQAEGEPVEEEETPRYVFGLDVELSLPGKVFVTGPGLESEWDGKLHIKNTAADPSIEGVLRVKKGTLDFLGRIFTLAESTITFDGQTPPLPYLRIDAVTTTDDVEAHVRMEGTQDNLNLSLESDPALPRDEILSRVLFGQRLSDVSPVQALTLARYAPMFKKNVSGRSVLGSKGPKPFLVDRISINSGTQVGETSITTGKYLSDDFYLEFQQGLGTAESLVSLDWIFAPQWALKGKTTAGGEGGLGVFWKKNY